MLLFILLLHVLTLQYIVLFLLLNSQLSFNEIYNEKNSILFLPLYLPFGCFLFLCVDPGFHNSTTLPLKCLTVWVHWQ